MRLSSALVAVLLAAGAALAQPPKETEVRKEAGNHFLKLRQYEAARDQYLAALQLDESYTDAHYNLGVVYFFRLQDYPRALYHFVRYTQLKPDASDLDQVRGLSLQALERIEAAERDAYAKALEEATPEALEAFVAAYPLSPYVPDAREKLRLLREREEGALRERQETQAAYEQALAKATPEAMDHFLSAHPHAPQAEEGRRLRDLWASRRSEDQKALDEALAAQTPAALESFLQERPRSPLAAEAAARLERLKTAEDAYRIAAQARSPAALEVFLAAHPSSSREAEARALLETLGEAAAAREARERVEREFQAAAATRDFAALAAFLAAHPDAPQAAEARRLQAQVDAERAVHEEEQRLGAEKEEAERSARAANDAAWNAADRADTAQAYREFRERFPQHPRADEARRREAALLAALPAPTPPAPAEKAPSRSPPQPPPTALEILWAQTQAADSPEAYERFLADHPSGDEAEAASSRLEELRSPDPGEEGASLPREKRQSLDRYRRMLQTE